MDLVDAAGAPPSTRCAGRAALLPPPDVAPPPPTPPPPPPPPPPRRPRPAAADVLFGACGVFGATRERRAGKRTRAEAKAAAAGLFSCVARIGALKRRARPAVVCAAGLFSFVLAAEPATLLAGEPLRVLRYASQRCARQLHALHDAAAVEAKAERVKQERHGAAHRSLRDSLAESKSAHASRADEIAALSARFTAHGAASKLDTPQVLSEQHTERLPGRETGWIRRAFPGEAADSRWGDIGEMVAKGGARDGVLVGGGPGQFARSHGGAQFALRDCWAEEEAERSSRARVRGEVVITGPGAERLLPPRGESDHEALRTALQRAIARGGGLPRGQAVSVRSVRALECVSIGNCCVGMNIQIDRRLQ